MGDRYRGKENRSDFYQSILVNADLHSKWRDCGENMVELWRDYGEEIYPRTA
jgi:hypothetical protein